MGFPIGREWDVPQTAFAEKQSLKHLGWTVPSRVQVGLGQVPTLESSQQGQRTLTCRTVSQRSGFRPGAA